MELFSISHICLDLHLFLGGAPAVATASGAFVAGHVAESIASSPGDLKGGDPRPPSFESAWRMESEPPVAYTGLKCPYSNRSRAEPEMSHEETSEPNDVKECGGKMNGENHDDGVKACDGKMNGGNGAGEPDNTPKDDIELGYSPGSPVASSAATPAPSAPSTSNKFDKIYHQNLGSNRMEHILSDKIVYHQNLGSNRIFSQTRFTIRT